MSYVYIESEHGVLWTVGFYKPDGKWVAESDHNSEAAAAARVHYLNGGTMTEREKKATGRLVSESLIMASFLNSLRNEASHSRDFTVTITSLLLETHGRRFVEAVYNLQAARMLAAITQDRQLDVVP